MAKTQKQLFEEWDDEERATNALAAANQWYQDGRQPVLHVWGLQNPDAALLIGARLSEQMQNADRRGEQHLVSASIEHDRTAKVNELLRSGRWRIANITTPVGCETFTETIDAIPVNGRRERTRVNFWAVVERV